MTLKYVTGPITKADAGGLDAVITTPRVDADGESVDPKGITNRDEWLTNPLIYWAHEWAFDPAAEPIGKGTRLDVHPDRIESSAVWAPTPKAQNVRALVSGGFVRKTSIGFDPLQMTDIKGTPTHTQWALREWSVVPMPANTEATITGVKSALHWLADEIAEDEPDQVEPNVIALKIDASELMRAVEALSELSLTSLDGNVELRERGKRIATIRRRRVAVLP
jgi:HK97 family phage prohead protease